MTTTRRDFTKTLGLSLVAPLALPIADLLPREEVGMGVGGGIEAPVPLQDLAPADFTRALLEAQGGPKVFTDPEEFEILRAALARKIRDHRIIRSFASELSSDIEPALTFGA